jgi:hypothetical protein
MLKPPPAAAPLPPRLGEGDDLGGDAKFSKVGPLLLLLLRKILGGFRGCRRNGELEDDADGEEAYPPAPPPKLKLCPRYDEDAAWIIVVPGADE